MLPGVFNEQTSWYKELYVVIYAPSGQLLGSGFCYDGKKVLTSAVLLSKAGYEVTLGFPESSRLAGRSFRAVLKKWGPGMLAGVNAEALVGFDIAVLELKDELTVELQRFINNVRFVSAEPGERYDCICYTEGSGAYHVNGSFGGYLPVEGKTQLNPAQDARSVFFKATAGGTPVFCVNGDGIAGIVSEQQLPAAGTVCAFMIDIRRIAALLDTIQLQERVPVKKEVPDFSRRKSLLAALAGLVGFALLLASRDLFLQNDKIAHFALRIRAVNKNNQHPIAGAQVLLLATNGDTLGRSLFSGSDGRIEIEIPAEVAGLYIIHPGFTRQHLIPEATANEKKVELLPLFPVDTAIPRKYFLKGNLLDTAGQRYISQTTGFIPDPEADTVFEITYNHNAYLALPGTAGFRFSGSEIILRSRQCVHILSFRLPASSSMPLTRTELERMNQEKLNRLLRQHRTELLDALIACLRGH